MQSSPGGCLQHQVEVVHVQPAHDHSPAALYAGGNQLFEILRKHNRVLKRLGRVDFMEQHVVGAGNMSQVCTNRLVECLSFQFSAAHHPTIQADRSHNRKVSICREPVSKKV